MKAFETLRCRVVVLCLFLLGQIMSFRRMTRSAASGVIFPSSSILYSSSILDASKNIKGSSVYEHMIPSEKLYGSTSNRNIGPSHDPHYDNNLSKNKEAKVSNGRYNRDTEYGKLEKAKYRSAAVQKLNFFDLSVQQKRNQDMSVAFFKDFSKLNRLSDEREKELSKFSMLGNRMKAIKCALKKRLDRDVSKEEWASVCKLGTDQLDLYLTVSQEAQDRLFQHNIRIVDHALRRIVYRTPVAKSIPYAELMGEGLIGLRKAAQTYNGHQYNTTFYKWAEPYVHGALLQGVSKLRSGNLVTHAELMISIRIAKSQQLLYKKLGRQATLQELADCVNISPKMVAAYKDVAKKRLQSGFEAASTNTPNNPSSTSGSELTNWDVFQRSDQTRAHLNELEYIFSFSSTLDVVSAAEKRAIALRYGLLDGQPKGLETVSDLMMTSRTTVQELIASGLAKMRQSKSASEFINAGTRAEPTRAFSGRGAVGGRQY